MDEEPERFTACRRDVAVVCREGMNEGGPSTTLADRA
jgi:hypothetical protein